jgi:hypothetical protein
MATRHPYYKYPVVVFCDREGDKVTGYRIEDLAGDEFHLPPEPPPTVENRRTSNVMKFLMYHGCYGVREDEMAEMRKLAQMRQADAND